jgi:prepilin-type N-terminal cleavage/methylation domain-containing protein
MIGSLLRRAFTLTELLTVLCILGLIASGSMFVLSATVRRAQRITSIESMIGTLAWARDQSFSEPVLLNCDFNQQVFEAVAVDSKRTKRYRCSRGVQLVEATLRGAQLDQGKLTVEFHKGSCSTFALRIKSDNVGYSFDKWLVMLGPSGETMQYEHSQETSAALAKWLSQWANLD